MSPKSKIKKRYIVLSIVLILTVLFIYRLYIREHSYLYIEQSLINNDVIEIEIDSNSRKPIFSWIHGEDIIGGGDFRIDLNFSYKGIEYHIHIPGGDILINYWENKFYIISLVWIGKKNERRLIYKFFKLNNKSRLKEITPEEFPKPIAIANIDYIRNYPQVEKPVDINVDLKEFRKSRTAGLWRVLLKNLKCNKECLLEYKKKYIDPYWTEESLKNNYPRTLEEKTEEANM